MVCTSCSLNKCFRQTSASKTACKAGVSSPVIYIESQRSMLPLRKRSLKHRSGLGAITSCSTCRMEI